MFSMQTSLTNASDPEQAKCPHRNISVTHFICVFITPLTAIIPSSSSVITEYFSHLSPSLFAQVSSRCRWNEKHVADENEKNFVLRKPALSQIPPSCGFHLYHWMAPRDTIRILHCQKYLDTLVPFWSGSVFPGLSWVPQVSVKWYLLLLYFSNFVSTVCVCLFPLFTWLCTTAQTSSIKKWFSQFGVEELDWSPLSADLNPIQHLWGELEHWLWARPEHQHQCWTLITLLCLNWSKSPQQVQHLEERLKPEWRLLGSKDHVWL